MKTSISSAGISGHNLSISTFGAGNSAHVHDISTLGADGLDTSQTGHLASAAAISGAG